MIRVYTQPACRPCKRIMQQFDAAGVKYQSVDITENSVAYDYVKQQLQANSTPVIEVEGLDVVRGYQPDKVKQIIEMFGDNNGS